MANYKLSNVAKEDLIRIHHYGVKQFGIKQADKYFESFFELIAENPLSFESVDFISESKKEHAVIVDANAFFLKKMCYSKSFKFNFPNLSEIFPVTATTKIV